MVRGGGGGAWRARGSRGGGGLGWSGKGGGVKECRACPQCGAHKPKMGRFEYRADRAFCGVEIFVVLVFVAGAVVWRVIG